MMWSTTSSKNNVKGIYTHILKRYQEAFTWLKPHLISYYKVHDDCDKKKTEEKVSAMKEKCLALTRTSLTLSVSNKTYSPDLSSDDCSSDNASYGDDGLSVGTVVPSCHQRVVSQLLTQGNVQLNQNSVDQSRETRSYHH
jgi:hypothetical protein